MNDNIKDIFGLIKKDLGEDKVWRGDDLSLNSIPKHCIPSGIPELDLYLGEKGGLPSGKVIEFYGKPCCTAASTHINYHVRNAKGETQNVKGGTIERLYRRFHRIEGGKQGAYQRPQTIDSYFTAPSMREDNTIVHNRIIDVVKTGRKECFAVKTLSGEEIHATLDHKFHDGLGYLKLSDLSVGDSILVHNNTVKGKGCTIQPEASTKLRLYMYVQDHPTARIKVVDKKYKYKVLSLARAVVEADMNNLTLAEYKDRLNKSDFEGMKFVPKEMHIHHIDENYRNDDRDNLVALSHGDHTRIHAPKIKFEAVFDKIISIISIGEQDTYDLKMETPYHNYVANRFVVSNSGKTTAALQAAAEWQKRGGVVMFIDSEHSFDTLRTRQIGVNPEEVIVVPVYSVEEVFNTINATIDSYFTAPSMREDNTIVHNRIIDVVKTGRKECFAVKTLSGEEIHATLDHKFHDGLGYLKLSDLSVGDSILVHNNTVKGKGCTIQPEASTKLRLYMYVQDHPTARIKVVDKKYKYKVLSLARAVVEADMNNLTLAEYKDRLNKSDFEGMKFVPKEMHIHHIDENYRNDDRDNLVALSHGDHTRIHAPKIKFEAVFDKIISIISIGEQDTYDLKMETPYHNYVANRFVVSNSGKTTAALQAAAEWQKRGGVVMFIDSEHSFDTLRTRQIGVNPEEVIVVPVYSVEEVFNTINATLDTLKASSFEAPYLFIVDSANGVPTEKDAESDMTDNVQVGFEARQIKRGVRIANAKLDTVPCQPTIIFINHAIAKIGGFGKQSEAGGGQGIKFYAAVRLEFVHLGYDKNKDERVGQKVKINIEKLKGGQITFPSFNVILRNKDGFDKFTSLRDAMIATGFAKRPKGSQIITLLPGTEYEAQIKTKEWEEWLINREGGYDGTYLTWRRWAISNGILKVWGGAS